MHEFSVVYRHVNGDVEGFVGTGFTLQAAMQDARRKVLDKCDAIGIEFSDDRFIQRVEDLREGEVDIVKNDFRLSRRRADL